jgi:hypothetical protein
MTTKAAIILAGVIILALATDHLLNTGTATMFMMRKMFDLVEHFVFWR